MNSYCRVAFNLFCFPIEFKRAHENDISCCDFNNRSSELDGVRIDKPDIRTRWSSDTSVLTFTKLIQRGQKTSILFTNCFGPLFFLVLKIIVLFTFCDAGETWSQNDLIFQMNWIDTTPKTPKINSTVKESERQFWDHHFVIVTCKFVIDDKLLYKISKIDT